MPRTLVTQLGEQHSNISVLKRDVSKGLPFLDESWIQANFTDPGERNIQHKKTLSLSDELVSELKTADIVVLGSPIYNFSVPASLKAWIDLVARARETFKYTENGPVGLLTGKKAYVVLASGGTKAGSDTDFAGKYLKHVLGFIGLEDVTIIAADQLMKNPENHKLALKAVTSLAA